LGLPPHADYRVAQLIFGTISAEACTENYVYGKDGKPWFVSGPFDTPERCREIRSTLEETCGPGGYHYIIGVGEDELAGLSLVEEDDPDWGEEDEAGWE
jgi:hypothetical protein